MKTKGFFLFFLMFFFSCLSTEDSLVISPTGKSFKKEPFRGPLILPQNLVPAEYSPASSIGKRFLQKKIIVPMYPKFDPPRALLVSIGMVAPETIAPEKREFQILASPSHAKGIFLGLKIPLIYPSQMDLKRNSLITESNPIPAPNSSLPQEKNLPIKIPEVTQPPSLPANIQEKTINSIPGSDLLLQFNKLNWTLSGESGLLTPVGFLGQKFEKEKTTFHFRPPKAGNFDLRFERQDSSTGRIEIQIYHLKLSESTVAGKEISPSNNIPKLDREQILEKGLALENETRNNEALLLYQENYSAEDPELNERIARLCEKLGDFPNALKYWERNSATNDLGLKEKSILGISRVLLRQGTRDQIADLSRKWRTEKIVPPENLFLDLVEKDLDFSLFSEAGSFFELYPKWITNPSSFDKFLFLRAKFLENSENPEKNVRQALSFYSRLVSEYPLSRSFGPAEERINFLIRNYFQLR